MSVPFFDLNLVQVTGIWTWTMFKLLWDPLRVIPLVGGVPVSMVQVTGTLFRKVIPEKFYKNFVHTLQGQKRVSLGLIQVSVTLVEVDSLILTMFSLSKREDW